MFKNLLLAYPPPHYFLVGVVLYSCSVSIQFYNNTPLGEGGGERGLQGKPAHTLNRVSRSRYTLVGRGGLKNAMEGFLGTVKIDEYV